MAVKKMKIEEFTGFGRRLMEVARDRGLGDPLSLAQAIHGNKKCRDMVKLRKREDKNSDSPYDEVDGIKRIIQKHLTDKYADAYKVPSAYMYAYSIVLECSIDYLYGKTEIMSTNLEVRDICEKTGLSEPAVNNLCSVHQNNNEDMSITRWWSDLLSEESFFVYPVGWMEYANRLVQLYDIKKKADAIEKATDESEMDEIYKLLNSGKADTLNKIYREKRDASFGAYLNMISSIEEHLKTKADQWAAEQHPDYDMMYYKSEINKIKIIESALKE